MDQATQQNAALVEEMAAAASSLKGQAQELVQAVAVFQLDANNIGATARQPAPAARAQPPSSMPSRVERRTAPPVAKATPQLSQAQPKPADSVPLAKTDAKDWESF
jgi:methyl-accepting chemotaxis protein